MKQSQPNYAYIFILGKKVKNLDINQEKSEEKKFLDEVTTPLRTSHKGGYGVYSKYFTKYDSLHNIK